MVKSLTTWNNPDNKPDSAWSIPARASTFWDSTPHPESDLHLYDDALIPYDSAIYTYDYNSPVANLVGSEQLTQWTAGDN
jgi:hypothetical protein